MNGMCMKNNTHIYVVWTSNNRVIPTEWSWWVIFNNACEPGGEQLIVLPDGNGQSDLIGWSLLLLATSVWSFAHLSLRLSDRNKMVLWPGCEGRANCRLHKKNVRLVRFIVKRRECCCNPSVGIALNVWFTTNGMCAKNNTHICDAYKQ